MLVRMSVFVVVGALVGGVQYLAAESSVLEEIETKDGKRFAGRVVGYDVESKSYVLRTRGGDLKIPESSILTVHAVSHADESPDEAGGSPESLVGSSESPVTPPVVSVEPGHQESLPVQPETHRVRAPRRHAELAEILEAATTEGADAFRHEDRLALEVARDALKEGDIGAARRHLETVEKSIAAAFEVRLLRGVVLVAEKKYDKAFRWLRRLDLEVPDNGEVLCLLAVAAQGRGYFARARAAMEKSITLRFEGADAHYRRFQWRRDHDPDPARVREAWQAYVESDPEFTSVESPEGNSFRSAARALEAGDHDEVFDNLHDALRRNPYIRTQMAPLHVRVIEERAHRLESAGDFEGAVYEFAALELEQPKQAEKYAQDRRKAEVRWVDERLAEVEGPENVTAALDGLRRSMPNLWQEHSSVLKSRLEAVARNAAVAGDLDGTLKMLDLIAKKSPGASLSNDLAAAIRGRIDEERANGRDVRVEEWTTALTERGRLQAVKRVQPSSGPGVGIGGESDIVAIVPPVPTPKKEAPSLEAGPTIAVTNGPAIASLEYLSLIAGNEWVYRHRDGTRDVQRLAKVEARNELPPLYRFKNRFELEDLVIPYEKICSVDDDFVYQGTGGSHVRADRVLPLPIREGSVWRWKNGEIEFEKRCVSTDETVHCLAGTFHDCLKIELTTRYGGWDGHSVSQTMYYAPYVGLVKVDSANLTDSYELETFTLGGEGRAQPSVAPMRGKSDVIGPDIPAEILPMGEVGDFGQDG